MSDQVFKRRLIGSGIVLTAVTVVFATCSRATGPDDVESLILTDTAAPVGAGAPAPEIREESTRAAMQDTSPLRFEPQ